MRKKQYSFVLLMVMALSLVVFAATVKINGEPGDGLVRFLGRFHVLALHYPDTLLLLAPVLSLLHYLRIFPTQHNLRLFVWWCGGVSAFFTVCLGLLLAANEGLDLADVRIHLLGGVSVALLALLGTALMCKKSEHRGWRWVYCGVSTGLVFAIFFAAHAGGNLVHGDTYLTRFAPVPLRNLTVSAQGPISAMEQGQNRGE